MHYTINNELNGIELTFDSKPSEEVRTQLKENGFRWHRQKKLWYAKNTKERVALIEGMTADSVSTTDWTGETSDGYLGAIRWDGAKSGKFLYGSELSKAIREDLKSHGIKGVTVSVSTYSMGQSITCKIKVSDSDFIPLDEWKKDKDIIDLETFNHQLISEVKESEWRGKPWYSYTYIDTEKYFDMSEEEKAEIFEINALHEWKRERDNTINHYHLDDYTTFTPELMAKIKNVRACLDSYRYDDSNSMVDYFDTNFYYDIKLKEVA